MFVNLLKYGKEYIFDVRPDDVPGWHTMMKNIALTEELYGSYVSVSVWTWNKNLNDVKIIRCVSSADHKFSSRARYRLPLIILTYIDAYRGALICHYVTFVGEGEIVACEWSQETRRVHVLDTLVLLILANLVIRISPRIAAIVLLYDYASLYRDWKIREKISAILNEKKYLHLEIYICIFTHKIILYLYMSQCLFISLL